MRHRCQLPNSPGIYFISNEREQLLYIGKAKNLRDRWAGKTHHRYKQFARRGLDKITLSYVLVTVSELDKLEKEYINNLNPPLNDTKVKEYLPKKSPRFSELQRLLKLASKPLFPSYLSKHQDGKEIPREAWDLFRGFVGGVYEENNKPYVVVICQQNMGHLLDKSAFHRTKKRFYFPVKHRYGIRWDFDARQAIFVFIEFYTWGELIFEQLYPHLVDCQLAGVTIKKLVDTAYLTPALKKLPEDGNITLRDYLVSLDSNLQPFPNDFVLDEQKIW